MSRLLSVGAWAPFDHIFKMERYPKEGETIQLDMDIATSQKVYFGDCCINIAAVAARLGVDTALASIVGNDFAPSGYREHLESLGINLDGLVVRPDQLCGHNYLFFDSAGDGFCFSHLGAAIRQGGERVPDALIQNATHIVASEQFSSYTLDALQRGKALGATTYLNGMVDTAGSLLEDFLYAASCLFINNSEYERLVQQIGTEDLLFSHYGISLIVRTRGKLGCDVLQANGRTRIPITSPPRVTDTTGAGDSFAAGTISALMKGYAPEEAARIGSSVSSFIIEDWGCQSNLPTWEMAIQRCMEQHKEDL